MTNQTIDPMDGFFADIDPQFTDDIDPFYAFELWMAGNGYQDVVESSPEAVDLERLDEAIEKYSAV